MKHLIIATTPLQVKIAQHIKGLYPNQEFELDENQNFIIDSNRKLTCLLKLALGRLYTNPITHHKMEANHAKKLN